MSQPIQHVVIVGGGTAGWMTAASLIHRLAIKNIKVTLVESSDIATVGVGEATVPAIRSYFASLGLDTYDVMKATQGTFKLGIEFKGWRHEGHRFFHPFARYGIEAGPVGFHHLWQRLKEAGEPWPLDDYCLGSELMIQGRFALPDPQPRADFQIYDWAVHFDASLFAKFLRGYAEKRGMTRIDAKVTTVEQNSESGFIERLQLDNGETIAGDLFIDCSGFRGLLIQGALKTGFRDWRKYLPCDRAVALPCSHLLRSGAAQAPRMGSGGPSPLPSEEAPEIAVATRVTAQAAGWMWRIPLQHRVGNGYVYSSDHISDADAEAALRGALDSDALANPNFVRFTAGHAEQLWNRNCVAIGLAGGFLEPLESTSITLIQSGINKLLLRFPNAACEPAVVAEYNRLSALEFERIRDFIILHYWASHRPEALWAQCRDMVLPDTLRHKIELYKASGQFARYDAESFFDPSFLCMYDGFDIEPRAYDPFADNFALDDLKELTRNIRADVKGMALEGERHSDFIRKHCAAVG